MGETPGSRHHRDDKRGERVGQRKGVVGGRRGEGQVLLHLLGVADLPQEGDEGGQPAEGRNGLGRLLQNELGLAEEGGEFRAGRFVQV